MKKSTIITSAILTVIIITAFTTLSSSLPSEKKKTDLTGSWKLDSYKYGNSQTFIPSASERPRLKLITDKTFLWISYDTSTGKIISSAGGGYTLEGDTYTESIEYGLGMDGFLGTKSTFRVKREDNTLFISGDLTGGLHIEEVWIKTE